MAGGCVYIHEYLMNVWFVRGKAIQSITIFDFRSAFRIITLSRCAQLFIYFIGTSKRRLAPSRCQNVTRFYWPTFVRHLTKLWAH